MSNNMEHISFIPNTQKGSKGYISRKEEHPYRGYIIGFVLALILYILTLGVVYWYYVVQPTNILNQSISSLNAKNNKYYPQDDLKQTAYNINSVITQIYDPIEMIKAIEATYGSNFKTTSWIYNKEKKNINISATATSFEAANEQITKMKEIRGVIDVSYPGINKIGDGEGVSLDITIKLK